MNPKEILLLIRDLRIRTSSIVTNKKLISIQYYLGGTIIFVGHCNCLLHNKALPFYLINQSLLFEKYIKNNSYIFPH